MQGHVIILILYIDHIIKFEMTYNYKNCNNITPSSICSIVFDNLYEGFSL